MDDSTFFIVGANGQVGHALQLKYPGAKSADIDALDITDHDSVENFDWSGIKIIFNAAAYTNVDGAETAEGRVAAWKVNAAAVANLARVSLKHDIALVHISTDYVFDGTQDDHTEDEPYSPLGVYAQTKAAGDIVVGLLPKYYILRTSWVIGEGKNFVRTMLDVGKRGIEPNVVNDQVGRLTFTSELVRAIDHLLTNGAAYGTYNVTNSGDPASWADFTRAIFKEAGFEQKITDTNTAEYYKGKEGIAPRPLKSMLDLSKLQATGFQSTDWNVDLAKYIQKEARA